MYTDQVYEALNAQWRRFWVGFVIGFAVFAGAFAACLIFRWQVAGYAISAVGAMVLVFCWGMFGSRLMKYRHWMRDMRTGIARMLTGEVTLVEGPVNLIGELEFMKVEIQLEGEAAGSEPRRVYYDAQQLPLPFQTHDRVEVITSGNYIQSAKRI